MVTRGKFTFNEIMEQPAAWEDAVRAFTALQPHLVEAWDKIQAKRVIFTGCGSTYYLSHTAASLFEAQTGVPSRAHPGSEFLLFPDRVLQGASETLLVTISRSGTTTETLQAQQAFRERGGKTNWAITCYPDSPLAIQADLVLPVEAAQEESIAQTRSFASMLLMSQALAAAMGGRDCSVIQEMPALARRILQENERLMAELGGRLDFDRLVFLGSSHQFGVANEAMLKMTEMSLSFSSAFHFLEYRHGPMSMANEKALISGLLSQEAFAQERQVLAEMKALGASTLALNPTSAADGADWQINLPESLPDWAMPVLYLPALQLLAYYRAMAKGLDPDNPRNLTAVVYLDA